MEFVFTTANVSSKGKTMLLRDLDKMVELGLSDIEEVDDETD